MGLDGRLPAVALDRASLGFVARAYLPKRRFSKGGRTLGAPGAVPRKGQHFALGAPRSPPLLWQTIVTELFGPRIEILTARPIVAGGPLVGWF